MRQKLLVLVLLTPALMGIDLLRSRNDDIEQGNAQMKAGKAEDALGSYDKAAAKLPADPGVHLNRGTALYALSRWDEAAQAFLRATEAKTPALKASAFYNLGNAQFQGGQYNDAVESFKKSLAYNPADQRAKWNLELALKKKKEEDQKKQNENQDNKSGDKKDDKQAKNDQKNEPGDKKDDKQGDKQGEQKPEQQDPQAQQDQKPGDQQKPEEQPSAQQQEPEKKPEPSPPKESPAGGNKDDKKSAAADMREIDAVLDSLERSPKALEQERARLRAVRRAPPVRDW